MWLPISRKAVKIFIGKQYFQARVENWFGGGWSSSVIQVLPLVIDMFKRGKDLPHLAGLNLSCQMLLGSAARLLTSKTPDCFAFKSDVIFFKKNPMVIYLHC